MKRILSIIALFSMVCSITAANAGVQVLCSHDDGFGHVVAHNAHEKETHASCLHQDSPEDRSSQDLSHEDPDCKDVVLDDSELEDLSSCSDRSKAKTPSIQLGSNAYTISQIDASLKDAARPPAFRVVTENKSRRFAKIVQIRC